MSLFSGLDTPKWMSPDDSSRINFEEGQQLAQNFTQAYQKAHAEQVQKPLRDLQMQRAVLGLHEDAQKVQLQQTQLEGQAADQTAIPAWLQEHPTWESRQNVSWPAARTPTGEKQLDSLRLNDSRSAQQKAAISDITDFTKRLGTINPTDRASIRSMSPNRDGTPSADQFMALSLAEQTIAQAKENQNTQAEIDAMARGDQATTKMTAKGIETTFKPKPADKTAGADVEPRTKTLDNGNVLAWMPNGKTIHVIHGPDQGKQLTPTQILSFSKTLDDKDPDKEKFMNFVKTGIIGQMVKTNSPAATRPGPQSSSPYKTNAVYQAADGQKLKFKGGDWNLEASWEKVP